MTRRPPFRSAALVVTLGLAVLAFAEDQTDPTLSAGDFTLKRSDATAFAEPAPVLTYKQQQTFMRGRQHFNQTWVIFPSMRIKGSRIDIFSTTMRAWPLKFHAEIARSASIIV